jgi:hypothetical protein
MENYTENSSELLHQMFDGELSPEMDEKLFSDLAQNPEMQTELNDMLKIRETISKDYEAFTPKEESKEAIFAALGFSKIAAEVAATSVGAGAGVGAGFIAKAWLPISASIVASVVTALIVVGVYENKDVKPSLQKDITSKIQVPISSSSEVAQTIDKKAESLVNSKNVIVTNSSKVVKSKSNFSVSTKTSKNQNDGLAFNSSSQDVKIQTPENRIVSNLPSKVDVSNKEEMMLLPVENKNLALITNSKFKQIETIRSLNLKNLETTNIIPLITIDLSNKIEKNTGALELSLLTNSSIISTNNISIGYNLAPLNLSNFLGSDIDVVPGIKLGRSEFLVAYSPENGVVTPSELKSIFYLAGQLRLEFKNLELAGFTPFVQGQVGYSNGSITKEIAGISFESPINFAGTKLTFLAGCEYSQFNQSTVSNIARTQGISLMSIIKF